MALDWSRERRPGAPLVGRCFGLAYRIYDDEEPCRVRVTLEFGPDGTPAHPLGLADGERELGNFSTTDRAARFVNLHFADLCRQARERALRQAHERERITDERRH